jgi:hypothetical protein
MCRIGHAQTHNFQKWDWKSIGHGHYCIFSDGFTYSHSDAEANYRFKSFKFKKGDVLLFKYDRILNKLRVQKQSEHFEMDVEKSIIENYSPCVYLKKDSVKFINV